MQTTLNTLFRQMLILVALCASLSSSGCSWREVINSWQFSSPEAVVKAYTMAETAEDAARCFPSSWPLSQRKAFFGRLGTWTEQRIVSVRPTVFTGERMSVYDVTSVVIIAEDQEIVQEVLREDGKQRFWYLLRDCEGQWKIIALFKNTE
ncbi:MAG: hypothetical protein KKE73_02500 [Proteobacteria bacterium]|nr:hypothetical protein [Pseudomonadota bacterium]